MAQADLTSVRGTCAPRFDLVRQEFERNFAERGEAGAAVAITVDGETVVDLWGGAAEVESGRPWDQDTTVVVWSCTKGATALCAHILADRGELDVLVPGLVDGIQAEALSNGENFYLGLAVSVLDEKQPLPFLDPREEKLLEYKLSRSISRPRKRRGWRWGSSACSATWAPERRSCSAAGSSSGAPRW